MTSQHIFSYADGSSLYKLSAKGFTERFQVWEANRTMDDTHVSDLEASIKSPTEIQGPFSVISYHDEENKVQNRVIDGQHRQEVLRRYFERNPGAVDFVLEFSEEDRIHETEGRPGILIVDGLMACTLGHYMIGPVISHPYFGQRRWASVTSSRIWRFSQVGPRATSRSRMAASTTIQLAELSVA